MDDAYQPIKPIKQILMRQNVEEKTLSQET